MELESHIESARSRPEDLSWQQRIFAHLRGIILGPAAQDRKASRVNLIEEIQEAEEERGFTILNDDPFVQKIQAIQMMWGEGFDSPCEENFALELVASLNLSKNNEVVELGAGLGGTGRTLAKQFGVSVTSLVWSEKIGRIAAGINNRVGLMGMVRVAPFKPERMGLQAKKNSALSRASPCIRWRTRLRP